MALLEEQFTETLDAGAPDITYEGNEGKEQQIAQALWDKLPPQMRMQFGSFAQFFSSGAWKKVLAALQQQMQGGEEEIRETETETIGRAPQEGLGALMPAPRPMAFGGVAGADGRTAYGLGSIFKKITRPIKKVLSSDLGKLGLTAAAIYGAGGGFGGPGDWGFKGIGPGGFEMGNILPNLFMSEGKLSPLKIGGALSLAPFAMQAAGKWDEGPKDFARKGGKFDFDYDQMREDIAEAIEEGDYTKFTAVLNQYNLTEGVQIPKWDTLAHGAEGGRAMAQGGRISYGLGSWLKGKLGLGQREGRAQASPDRAGGDQDPELMRDKLFSYFKNRYSGRDDWRDRFRDQWTSPFVQAAQGGRIRAQEGGLMDLGGMEKDYRNDGGFVPLGGEEKADDVPARLSKNEFVFTADAVRAAGGGDIDQGAEVMENVMKNLERGGEISEESQGQGARDMFSVSERLSEVV